MSYEKWNYPVDSKRWRDGMKHRAFSKWANEAERTANLVEVMSRRYERVAARRALRQWADAVGRVHRIISIFS